MICIVFDDLSFCDTFLMLEGKGGRWELGEETASIQTKAHSLVIIVAFEKVIEIYDVIVGEEGIIPFHCLS